MNEYQDQGTWWEVQRRYVGWNGVSWISISDHDSREEAEAALGKIVASRSEDDYRVKRESGLL